MVRKDICECARAHEKKRNIRVDPHRIRRARQSGKHWAPWKWTCFCVCKWLIIINNNVLSKQIYLGMENDEVAAQKMRMPSAWKLSHWKSPGTCYLIRFLFLFFGLERWLLLLIVVVRKSARIMSKIFDLVDFVVVTVGKLCKLICFEALYWVMRMNHRKHKFSCRHIEKVSSVRQTHILTQTACWRNGSCDKQMTEKYEERYARASSSHICLYNPICLYLNFFFFFLNSICFNKMAK